MTKEIKEEIYQSLKNIVKSYGCLRKYVIVPFGQRGKLIKEILKNDFNIQDVICIDNYLSSDPSEQLFPVSYIEKLNKLDLLVILSVENVKTYYDLRVELRKYTFEDNIISVLPPIVFGKYTYGSICYQQNYAGIESIGAFSSIANGAAVEDNHAMHISTHELFGFSGKWEKHPAYVYGTKVLNPRSTKKTRIGNDVWIGKNVTIIAGNNIGDGAIVGAGAVVTHDIPPYAIACGVPAKIVKYRYESNEIELMNKIAWWNWNTKKIIECQDDFYLDIKEFISKHYF